MSHGSIELLWKEGFENVSHGSYKELQLDSFKMEARVGFGGPDYYRIECRPARSYEVEAGMQGNVFAFENQELEGIYAETRITLKLEDYIRRIRFKLMSRTDDVVQFFNQDDRFMGEVQGGDHVIDFSNPRNDLNRLGRVSVFYEANYAAPTIDSIEGFAWKI